jgi:hypothetical protein
MIVIGRGDRHIERSPGSYEVQVRAPLSSRCAGGFACALDDPVFAHQGQDGVKVRLGDRGRRADRALDLGA